MEKLIFKKMKKVILIFSLVVPFIVTNTEFVKAAESNYKINEIINEDGVAEIVIRVLENIRVNYIFVGLAKGDR